MLSLARALSADNEITIVTPRVPGAAAYERCGDVEIRRFPYFPRRLEGLADGAIMPNLHNQPWRLLEVAPLMAGFLWTAYREIRRNRPDLIHAHWILPGGLVALALHAALGIPYIVTAHGVDVFGLRAPPFRLLKRWVLRKAAIVSPASSEMAAILGLPPEEAPRLVVPMGVDAERLQQAVGERAPEEGRFLFVGRLAEKKGLDVLLSALVEVPAARLVIVGDGPERVRFEALATRLGVGERATFLGQQDQDHVAGELRLAHALVVPSKVARGGDADATPLVMSEGMAVGVPVIASRLGGLAEQITSEENGLLVEPDSPEALAEALRRVLERPQEARGWAEAARQRMRETLDVRATARRYQEFIDAVVQEPRRDQAG